MKIKIARFFRFNKILIKSNTFCIISCCLSFLLGLGFFGFEKYILLLLSLFVLFIAFINHRIRLHLGFFAVLFFSFFISLFSIFNYGFSLADLSYYLFFPLFGYLIGSTLLTILKKDEEEQLDKIFFNFIFFLCFGFAFRAFLGVFTTAYSFGFFGSGRSFVDIWESNVLSINSATGMQLTIIPITAISLPILVIKSKYRKWFHIALTVFGLSIAIYVGSLLQSRGFFVCIGILILMFPFLLFNRNPKLKNIIIAYFGSIILLLFVFWILLYVSEDFRNFVYNIPILNRFLNGDNNSTSERLEIISYFFHISYKYPFGGIPMAGVSTSFTISHYFHNLWLDAYRVGGVIPFLFLIFISIHCFKMCFDGFLNLKTKSLNVGVLLFFSLCFFTIGMFEPIYSSNPYFVSIIFICYGAIETIVFNTKSEKIENKYYKALNKDNIKICFVSNFLSLHTLPIHKELIKKYGDKYCFIEMEEKNKEHLQYKYSESVSQNVVRYYKQDEKNEAERILADSNVILAGSVSTKFIIKFLNKNKIFFKVSERIFKKGLWQCYSIKAFLSYIKNILPLKIKTQCFCLALSQYTAFDYNHYLFAVNKTYEWAYLCDDSKFNDFDKIHIENSEIIISFVNRLISWKHPEKVIELGNYLNSKHICFHINIIGDGEKKDELLELTKKYNLSDKITFFGIIPNEQTRKILAESNILVSCSSVEEGWGASINEGMQEGCAVVASNTCGASGVLIENGVDGFIYNYFNDDDFFKKVMFLCKNREILNQFGSRAFHKMKTIFSPNVYIDRFDELLFNILDGKNTSFKSGPLSLSKNINEIDESKNLDNKLVEVSKQENTIVLDSGKTKNTNFKSGATISYITVIISILTGFFLTPWIYNSLGSSNYAIYSLSTSIVAMFAIDLGLGAAVSKFISKYRAEKDIESSNKIIGLIFKIFIILDAILFLILLIIFIFLGNIYVNLTVDEISTLRIVFIIVAIYSLISFEFTPLNGILMGNNKFPQYKVITLISKITYLILVIVGLIFSNNIYIYVLAVSFSGIIEMVIKYIYIKKKCSYGSRPILFTKKYKGLLKPLLKFSLWAAIAAISSRFIISINQSILGIFAGTTQITLFAMGAQIEGYTWQFSNALDGMFMPLVSEMDVAKKHSDDYTKLMIKVGRIQLIITGIIIMGFISLGKNFVNDVWMASNSDNFDSTYYVAVLLLLPAFVTYTQQIGKTSLLVKDKNKYYAIAMIITSVLATGLGFIFCSIFPSNGAVFSALAIFIAKIIGLVIVLSYFYKKVLGINIKAVYKECQLKYLPIFVITILFGFAIDYLIPNTEIMYFAIKVLLMLILYSVIIFKIYMNKSEKKMFYSILDKMYFASSSIIFEKSIKIDNTEEKESIYALNI